LQEEGGILVSTGMEKERIQEDKAGRA